MQTGAYIIEVDPGCTLDAAEFMLQGVDKITTSYMFNITPPEILNVSLLIQIPWSNLSSYMQQLPHLRKLDIPRFDRIPRMREDGIEREIKQYLKSYPWYKSWWFWIVVIICLSVLGFFGWRYFKLKWCQRPSQPDAPLLEKGVKSEEKELATLSFQQSHPLEKQEIPMLYPFGALSQFRNAYKPTAPPDPDQPAETESKSS